ncbi:MAG: hypothetical protein STSR0008_24810 [Ignavibacterium sp.]
MHYTKNQRNVFFLFIVTIICYFSTPMYAQFSTKDDIHLFQSFFHDASLSTTPYGELGLSYYDYEHGSIIDLGAQGGIPIVPKFELGTGLYFRSINPEGDRDGESGITDIPVYGRYLFVSQQQVKFSGGAYLTLPVGSEDIEQSNTNFGFFGAVRYGVSNQVALTGTLGLDFLEAGDDDRETSLNLGFGTIISATNELNIIAELLLQTETDYAALSGGIDYKISSMGHIRGALLLGLDDGAPDLGISGGFLFNF